MRMRRPIGLKLLTGIGIAGLWYLLEREQGTRHRKDLPEDGWPFAGRLGAGILGSALAWHGAHRPIIPGIPIALLGVGLLGRALSDSGLSTWLPVESQPSIKGQTVTTLLTVNAPIDRVFDFWAHYDETFPQSLTRVKQITAMGEGRARWVIDGPGSADIIWNTITRSDPKKELAWRTAPGSAAQHTGRVKFIETGDDTTTLRVHLTYNALAEAIIRSLAGSLGMGVNTLLQEELNRMKKAIESGALALASTHRSD